MLNRKKMFKFSGSTIRIPNRVRSSKETITKSSSASMTEEVTLGTVNAESNGELWKDLVDYWNFKSQWAICNGSTNLCILRKYFADRRFDQRVNTLTNSEAESLPRQRVRQPHQTPDENFEQDSIFNDKSNHENLIGDLSAFITGSWYSWWRWMFI